MGGVLTILSRRGGGPGPGETVEIDGRTYTLEAGQETLSDVEREETQTGITVQNNSYSIPRDSIVTAVMEGNEGSYRIDIADSEEATTKIGDVYKSIYGNRLPHSLHGYEITMTDTTTDVPVTALGKQRVEITMPLPSGVLQENLHVVCLDADGQLEEVDSRIVSLDGQDAVAFQAAHFSAYGIYNYGSGSAVADVKDGQAVFVSATPGPYERGRADQVVEQVIRPTGLLDPRVEVRPVTGQIDDLMEEINAGCEKERVLVTTLTKKMAEDLTAYLQGVGIKVRYLHHDIDTMERQEIIRDLRLGVFHVLVGINLLREGLDLPEVSLVAVLDADKEGFLRSETSLIQTIGRAARNANGVVILYADAVTPSMAAAMDETKRRRAKQDAFNQAHGIVPKTIVKEVRGVLNLAEDEADVSKAARLKHKMSRAERDAAIAKLEKRCARRPSGWSSSTPPFCATRSSSCGDAEGSERPCPNRKRKRPTSCAFWSRKRSHIPPIATTLR